MVSSTPGSVAAVAAVDSSSDQSRQVPLSWCCNGGIAVLPTGSGFWLVRAARSAFSRSSFSFLQLCHVDCERNMGPVAIAIYAFWVIVSMARVYLTIMEVLPRSAAEHATHGSRPSHLILRARQLSHARRLRFFFPGASDLGVIFIGQQMVVGKSVLCHITDGFKLRSALFDGLVCCNQVCSVLKWTRYAQSC